MDRRRWFSLVVIIAGVLVMLCQAPSVYKIVQAVAMHRDVYTSFNDHGNITTFVYPSPY